MTFINFNCKIPIQLYRSAKNNKIESIGENDFKGLEKLETL
jgi:hypothetical protein